MKVAVVYWTGTGNTEMMANAIADGAKENGKEVDIIFSDDFKKEMMKDYSSIAFGCPAMGNEELEESSFEPMFSEIEGSLSGKSIAIFGSYEWNDGQWMRDWEKRVEDDNAVLLSEPLAVYGEPDSEAIEKCKNIGKSLK